jgi:hypothetical protein
VQPSHPDISTVSVRGSGACPLLLVDVDGVISLFGFEPAQPPAGRWTTVDGIPHLISTQTGALLNGLADRFEMVWCTGWEDKAPDHLPTLLGLTGDAYPHLVFTPGPPGRHWKLAAIDAHAGPDRPVAWIDDQFDATCDVWAAERPGATLLVRTHPAVGMTDLHAAALAAWADAIRAVR